MNFRATASTRQIRSNNRLLVSIILGICEACSKNKLTMSVPQGAFAAKKVRKNMEKHENQYFYEGKKEASHYNSKYMNSIWGMYNRFSVHNLKKIMDNNQPQANVGAVKGFAASSNLSVSAERLSYLPM